MAVFYEDGEEVVYKSGNCAHRQLDDGNPAQLVVFCKTALCDLYT